MPQSPETLATLIGSRLCHDLISPIGAIQNGLELMSMSGAADTSPEMELIQDSCNSATARIKFFRVAFGQAGDGQKISHREITTTFDALCKGSRMQAVWMPEADMLRADVQLAYLAYLCCESAMPLGGAVKIEHGVTGWLISVDAPRLSVTGNLWDHLNGTAELIDLPANKVQFAMLPIMAAQNGSKLHAAASEDRVQITISAP